MPREQRRLTIDPIHQDSSHSIFQNSIFRRHQTLETNINIRDVQQWQWFGHIHLVRNELLVRLCRSIRFNYSTQRQNDRTFLFIFTKPLASSPSLRRLDALRNNVWLSYVWSSHVFLCYNRWWNWIFIRHKRNELMTRIRINMGISIVKSSASQRNTHEKKCWKETDTYTSRTALQCK